MNPARIDVARARRDAKRLLAAARAGDPQALAALRRDRPPRLADAQHAVARSLGYARWNELVLACEDSGAALRRAARAGDDDALYRLLEDGAPPNAADPRTGRTALLDAAAADQLDTVAALVGWVPVDRQARDRRGRSARDLARSGSPVERVLLSCGFGPPRGPLAHAHATLADAAEAALLDHLSRTPGVDRFEVGDGFGLRTGLHDNSRNGVVSSRLPRDVDTGTVIARFTGTPARWYVGEDGTEAGDLRKRLVRAGCEPERSSVHMAAALTALDAARSPDVREVHDVDDLVHLDLAEARLLAAAGAPLRHFVVGRVAGLTTFTTGTTTLGVHLRVERSMRRHGLARTLVRHATTRAVDDGATHAVLAPTPATIPLYERLGLVLEQSRPDRWYYLPDP